MDLIVLVVGMGVGVVVVIVGWVGVGVVLVVGGVEVCVWGNVISVVSMFMVINNCVVCCESD